MPKIEHQTYADGHFQMLKISGKISVGMMQPDEYEFTAEYEETIKADNTEITFDIAGEITTISPGEEIVIPAGTTFKISCIEPAAYFCKYNAED